MTGVYDMMHKLKKALPWWVMVLVLAVGAMDLRAEDTIMEAIEHAKVCRADEFMQAVLEDREEKLICRMAEKGSTGLLVGMLNATTPLYLLIANDTWIVTAAKNWKIKSGGKEL